MEENQLLNNLDEPPSAAGETLLLVPSSGINILFMCGHKQNVGY